MIEELEELVRKWRADTQDRDDKSGYERGVDYAFVKAAEELAHVLAKNVVRPVEAQKFNREPDWVLADIFSKNDTAGQNYE